MGFQDQISLNAGQKYCTILQGEHSAICSAFIKLPVVSMTFVLSMFEWPFYTGFTVVKISDQTKHLEVKFVKSTVTSLIITVIGEVY